MPQKKHNGPKSEVTVGCEFSKNVPDDSEKNVTDVIGPKEVIGGSEPSQNEFPHKTIDMNENDQSKQRPETDDTENPNGPESEVQMWQSWN